VLGRLRTYLTPGAEETERFRWMLRNTVLVGFVLTVLSEAAHYVSPQFPQDTVGSAIMAGAFAVVGVACQLRAGRLVLAGLSVGLFAIMGWWIARAVGESGGIYSLHRDAIYGCLAGAHALLLFSAFEFTVVTVLFIASFATTGIVRGDAAAGDYAMTFFYVAAFYCLAMVGIFNRTRLQRSERRARDELEALARDLEARVSAQVERIRRGEELARYLPPELSERVLAGERGPELAHGRRDVAVLCAAPWGFLESLTRLDPDQVAPLVNRFVAELTRVAFDHGGVIERFVGPRITVLFGALEEEDTARSVARAVAMATDTHQACNRLLRQWEAAGHGALRLRMGIGITAGTAVVGTFGSERRVEYTALGEAVVRAHLLASTAIPGEIRLDESAAAVLDRTLVVAGEPVEFTPGLAEPTFLHGAVPEVARPVTDAGDTQRLETPALAPTVMGDSEPGDAREPALGEGALFDGRYRIEERIGRGGMATVYRATHEALGEVRALKLLHPGRLAAPGALEQFRRETEATSRIQHPNVVRLRDFGRSLEGHYYLALDFVSGGSLAELIGGRPMVLDRAVGIAADILSALHAAHELRLVHRDLKPANVLIDGDGNVRVTDFGMVQPLSGGLDPHGDLIVGTPAYMSPEQFQGRPLDARSDLYSFGITFHEMLAGALPPGVGTEAGPGPLWDGAPDLPAALIEVVEDCLRRDPSGRPRSALAVQRRLWAATRDLAAGSA
jgi:class 3 adenylate cyclase